MTHATNPNNGITFTSLAPLVGTAAGLVYGLGLLTVNSYLFMFGASDFGLFHARFVLTGLTSLVVLSLCGLLPFIGMNLVYGARFELSSKPKVEKTLLGATIFIVAFCCLATPVVLLTVYINLSSVYSLLLILTSMSLVGSIILLFVPSLQPKRFVTLMTAIHALVPYVALAMIAVTFFGAFVAEFSGHVFPRIPEQLGGARPRPAVLLINHEDVVGVRQLGVPMSGGETSMQIELVFTGEDFVLVRAVGVEETILLKSEVLLGIHP
jgi:hypothetical protein